MLALGTSRFNKGLTEGGTCKNHILVKSVFKVGDLEVKPQR